MLTDAGTLDDAGAGGLTISETATARWLNVEEIVGALTNPLNFNREGDEGENRQGFYVPLCPAPPDGLPPSGTLLLYDRTSVPNFKKDQHEWIKRRGKPTKVREDHVKLRLNDEYRVAGTYVHSAVTSTVHRRSYRLIGDTNSGYGGDGGGNGPRCEDLVLVHYLDTMDAARVSALYADHIAAAASKRLKKKKKPPPATAGGGTEETLEATISSDRTSTLQWGPGSSAPHAEPDPLPTLSSSSASASAGNVRSLERASYGTNRQQQYQQSNPQHENLMMTQQQQESHQHHHPNLHHQQETHNRDGSLDDSALTILWDMVLEEGPTGCDLEDELKEAAATAIDMHMSPELESTLAGKVDEAIQEAATSSLEENPNLEEQLAMAATTDDDIRHAVENALNEKEVSGDLLPDIEEVVTTTLEDAISPQLQQKLVATMKSELNDIQEEEEGKENSQSEEDEAMAEDEEEEAESEDIGKPHASTSFAAEMVFKTTATGATTKQNEFLSTSVSVPQTITNGEEVPQTPLPEIVDFTPSDTMIDIDGNPTQPHHRAASRRRAKVVISTSASIPILPPDDLPYRWHLLACFVDIGDTSSFVPQGVVSDHGSVHSSSSSSPPHFSPDPLIMKVALSSLVKITPFSYKCEVPSNISGPGLRSLIVVGVRWVDDETTEPFWDAIRVAVKVCIQAEWSMASDLNKACTTMAPDLVRPKFYAPAGSGNVQLLTQLSQELFEFVELPAVSMVPSSAQAAGGLRERLHSKDKAEVCSSSNQPENMSSSAGNTSHTGLPAPSIAAVASALTSFPMNPPPMALGADIPNAIPGSDIANEKSSGRNKRTLSHMPSNALLDANAAASDWVTSSAPGDSDMTKGEIVDRHCKIRFVERLANVIVGTEESGGQASEGGRNNNNGGASQDVVVDPAFLLGDKDKKLDNVDDDELDSLLHSVLMRFVESMVDSCTSEDELRDSVNTFGLAGFTLLHYAALYNIVSLVPLLLSKGADPNMATVKGGLTPLHLAAGAGHDQIVATLVRKGASIDAMDSFGLVAADHAVRGGFHEIAEWLCDDRDGIRNAAAGGGTAVTRSISAKSSKNVNGGHLTDSGYGKNEMMQDAFKELSLRDKLGLNLFRQRYKGQDQGGNDETQSDMMQDNTTPERQFSTGVDDNEQDMDFKFISEEDRKSLKVAMSLMSKNELDELEQQAPFSSVRDWMLRSNYESLREASIQLEKQAKRKALSSRISESRGTGDGDHLVDGTGGDIDSGGGRQGNKRNQQQYDPKKLSQVLAMLVLRKNLLKGEKGSNRMQAQADSCPHQTMS